MWSGAAAHLVLLALLSFGAGAARSADARGAEDEARQGCHGDRNLTTDRGGRTVSLFVDPKAFSASVHAPLGCTGCHADLAGAETPHEVPVARVDCASCHTNEGEQHARSLHGRAVARGDPLAPRCADCHGKHDILPAASPRSAVPPLKVPFVCGQCHREKTPVQRNRIIHQANILENYSESIHGEGLLRKGLIVAPTCASCHTAHLILPHTDPGSSVARRNIAATCTKCHAEIEAVHRKVIKGELRE